MKKMGLNEIRETYLSFFETKGHLRLPSFPLIPQNEKSLLLINAGMAPMKPWFSGEQLPPRRRVTTCQKCIRTPDIERVGKTARHGTFFEMLGNFSFGDYFKHDACHWAWEFCTKVIELPPERLYVSVYLDDDEAFDIWTKEVGVDPSHMVRFGKEDNFWEIGSGPCGPCSEIYFDRGEEYGCGKPDCKVGCDCDRYVEFWNLVFTQFHNDGNGNYTPLPQKNIDTGMGLERLACIMQGVNNLFEVDTVCNVMRHIVRIAGKDYKTDEKTDVSLRVITDHIRSTTMLVCDGVLPGNEGRGYVLRRLLRRAARHGRLLGITHPFLHEVAKTVIAESSSAYPELKEKEDYIIRVIKIEEERFSQTIDTGLGILNDMMDELRAAGQTELSGANAFKLYDTFGFPIDLTLELLDEAGLTLDRPGFDACMDEQRTRARAAHAAAGDFAWAGSGLGAVEAPTAFVGYDHDEAQTLITHIFVDGESRGSAPVGTDCTILLAESPFYAESGGQVGDIGVISAERGAVFQVTDVKKTPDGKWLHSGSVVSGEFSVSDAVTARIDVSRRCALRRAHSSTHLLQAALRERLGTHVAQAGSLVEPDALRFDFTHFSAMTAEDIGAVEERVNAWILAGLDITTTEMKIDDARAVGATALFGEKYGEVVRVVKMGGCSTELCGGTHLANTARAGLFRITAESSVAAGVRRIEAVTGTAVLGLVDSLQQTLNNTAAAMKTSANDVVRRAAQLTAELSAAHKEAERLSALAVRSAVDTALASPADLGGVGFAVVSLGDTPLETIRKIGDDIKTRTEPLLVLFSAVSGDKLSFAAFCTKAAISRGLHAGNLVRAVAQLTGGNGGGRPDSATAGGKDLTRLGNALAAAEETARRMLK